MNRSRANGDFDCPQTTGAVPAWRLPPWEAELACDSLPVVRRFVDAINRHDVDSLLALMTEDHRFIDSEGTVLSGRGRLESAWRGYFEMVPDYSLVIDTELASEALVALFGAACGTLAVGGAISPENRWSAPVGVRACVESNRVREWQVYADNEPIRALMRSVGKESGG